MAIKQFNPYTASRRHMTVLSREDITKQKPERSLLAGRKKRTGGRNNYGHPTPEAMERISASGAAICRNDELGAVMIRPDRAGRIRINCMKPAS